MGFYSGDIRELTNDLKALRPTVMPAVPRLLNRVYDKIQNELGRSGMKRMLFNWALRSKEAEIKRGILRKDSLWDRIVFKKVQDGECYQKALETNYIVFIVICMFIVPQHLVAIYA